MKQLLILSALLLLITCPASAQRPKLFRSIIYTSQGERIDGILYDMTDSTVRYVPNQADINQRLLAGDTVGAFTVHYHDIDRIVIRRRGHVGRGFLIGTGLGVAYSIGIAVFTRPASGGGLADLSNVIRGLAIVVGPIGGALYGTLVSLIPYRMKRIRYNDQAYRLAKKELKWLSVRAQQRVKLADSAGTALPNR